MSPGWPILIAGLLALVFGEYLRRLCNRSGSYSEVYLPVYLIGGALITFASAGLALIDGEYLPVIIFGGITLVGGAIYCDGLARDRW